MSRQGMRKRSYAYKDQSIEDLVMHYRRKVNHHDELRTYMISLLIEIGRVQDAVVSKVGYEEFTKLVGKELHLPAWAFKEPRYG